tara:strand:- start:237 stop:1460 length:1224 start_codon:yes stop_codon:yes gene_type:complete
MAGINHIRRWVMSQMTKKADDGIMITLPDSKKVDLNVNITMDRLLRNGFDPDAFTNPQQVDNAVNMLNSRIVSRTIPADSAEGREITQKIFGKQKAPVFDLEGNRIPEGSGIMGGKSIKSLMESGQVTKGARGMKKSKKVQDREMFEAANKRLTSDVDSIIKDIKSMEPITAMKEANSVIARKGKYKNLTEEQSKKILQDTEDHIFERDIPEEDFATGGRAGFKMGRRAFLKLMGGVGAGIGAAKTGLLKLAGKEPAKQVTKEVVKQSASTPPPYFFKLVEKIRTLGDDTLATTDKAVAKKYKDYVMEEDFAGNIEIIKKGGDDMFPEDVYMSYKVDEVPIKGKKGSAKVEDYEEYTARPDMEGKMKDVEPGVPDEVVQEGTMFEDNMAEFGKTKKASGGIARMLGE